jgi:predicted GH43/DUF377 family glycosyl hydrolase
MTTPPGTDPRSPGRPQPPLTLRTDVLLQADPRRVVARIFLPGQEMAAPGTSRAAAVVARCLSMSEPEVDSELVRVLAGHGPRHRRFTEVLDAHFAAVAHRIEAADTLSAARRRLIGAYFTQEYALESAALFNPSVVAHPQQGPDPDRLRFVMSARAVGEGHLSSIVFRSGELRLPAADARVRDGDRDGRTIALDPGSILASAGTHREGMIDRERLRHQATAIGVDAESLRFILGGLPEIFAAGALDTALDQLRHQHLTRVHAERTVASVLRTADASYDVEFDPETDLSERTLLPWAAAESHGMEDARFVRFTREDGTATYLATYTAYDGVHVAPARLQTDDFRTFRAGPLTGPAATDKGLSLFPRRVGGRYLALSRWDRENNALAFSDDGYHWDGAVQLQSPRRPWELIQVGNCGSPVETAEGWLAFTHGVGPMRQYSLGAILLDLDDPSRIRGRLQEPFLQPAPDERDGYVPNVVYSCGALRHGRTLLLPYGCSDSSIRMTLIDLPELVARLLAAPGRQAVPEHPQSA